MALHNKSILDLKTALFDPVVFEDLPGLTGREM
jgi:hypothetical protein